MLFAHIMSVMSAVQQIATIIAIQVLIKRNRQKALNKIWLSCWACVIGWKVTVMKSDIME